jgi:acyl-coenzyme A synthetase/AMP-(fatty) acid ligase
MSDRAINAAVACILEALDTYEDFKKRPKQMGTCLTLNMSWVYAMVDMLNVPLGLGMEVVCLPVGGTNPRYSDAIEEYGVNILFSSKSILDSWLKSMPDIDLSKLKFMFLGGTYISPEYKQKFNDYLRSCGSTARVINGYGLSELGGAGMLSPSSRMDDAIGFLLPGFKAETVWQCLSDHYAGQQMVTVAPLGGDESVIYSDTMAGKDTLRLWVTGHDTQTMVTAVFDNLGKGASGAAIQNMNILLGLPETTGLSL